jgi:glycosyltransferase involved in cell wall biosynthesis
MRVLIVNPNIYIYGGAERVIVKLCDYLSKAGIETCLITTSIIPEVKADLPNTRVVISPNVAQSTIGEMRALHGAIKSLEGDFDIINAHNFPANFCCLGTKTPVVWMCNEPGLHINIRLKSLPLRFRLFYRALAPLERFVVRQYVARVVVADSFNAQRVQRLYGVEPAIINYGIDQDFFSETPNENAKETLGFSGKFVVLHVGMLTPFKNQMASLETIDRLRHEIPNVLLLLAGAESGPYKDVLEEYIKRKDLHDCVRFMGHVDRAALRRAYYACDVLLHPIKDQGGWLSIFEAMCAEKPVVTSRDLTAADIVEKNNLGTVTGDYAAAILDIYRTPDKYRKRSEAAKTFVRNNFTWNRF